MASMSHTVLRSSSMQYQSLPPAVTSYCHCSIVRPETSRVPRSPRSGCWRSELALGSSVSFSQATLALAAAAVQICSHPKTAALVAYRKSHPAGAGGGETRSRRFGNAHASAGTETVPPSARRTATRSRLAKPGCA